jgi:signal peptidase
MEPKKFDLQELFGDDPELFALLSEAPARPVVSAPAFAAARPSQAAAFDLRVEDMDLDFNLDLRDLDMLGGAAVSQAYRPAAPSAPLPAVSRRPLYGETASAPRPAAFNSSAYRPPAAHRMESPSPALVAPARSAFASRVPAPVPPSIPTPAPVSAAPVAAYTRPAPRVGTTRVFMPPTETNADSGSPALDPEFGLYFNSILNGRPIPPEAFGAEAVAKAAASDIPVGQTLAPSASPVLAAAKASAKEAVSARFGEDDLRNFLHEHASAEVATQQDPFRLETPLRADSAPATPFQTASLSFEPEADQSHEEPEPVRRGLWRRVGGFVFNTVFFLVCAALVAFAVIFAIRDDPDKDYFGYRFLNVQTDSMQSADDRPGGFAKGDVIVVQSVPLEEIALGDVITFRSAQDQQKFLTYRVVDIQSSSQNGQPGVYYLTRGDAAMTEDVTVAAGQVVGKAVFVIPELGTLLQVVRDHYVLILIFLGAAFVLSISLHYALGRTRRERRRQRRAEAFSY